MRNRKYCVIVRSLCIMSFLFFFAVGCSLPRIVIIHDPLSAAEHTDLGRIYESQGKNDLALQQYQAALKKDPKSLSTLLLLGDLGFRMKNYVEAESAYTRAIKLQPDNGDNLNNLSLTYLEQNTQLDKSEELARRALSVSPSHRAYYLDTLGMVLLRQGKVAESITTLSESVALIPKDKTEYLAEAYGHLAEAYRAAGDQARADEAMRQAEQYRVSR